MLRAQFFFFLAGLLFILSSYSFSQKLTYPDAGLWTTVNVEKGISPRFAAVLAQEFRLKENFSRLNLFYTNLGLEFKITQRIKTAIIYRHVQKFQDDNTFSYRNRIMFDISFRTKTGKIISSFRQRFQAEGRNISTSRRGSLIEWYGRSKFMIKYDTDKKWNPYMAAEFRFQFRDLRRLESENTWHRARLSAGIDYRINKRNTLGAYYLVQREWNVNEPNYLYIVGAEYTLEF